MAEVILTKQGNGRRGFGSGSSLHALMLALGSLLALAIWYAASFYDVRGLGADVRPERVLVRLIRMLSEKEFQSDYLATLGRVAMAAGSGVFLAVLLGLAIGVWPWIDWMTRPLIYTLQSIPIIVLGLIFLLILGPTHVQAVSFVLFAVCLSVTPMLATAVRAVEPNHVRIGKAAGFRPLKMITEIVVPTIMPTLIDGCRAALVIAWSFMTFAEVLGGDVGLGVRISEQIRFDRSTDLFAYVVVITVSVIVGDALLRLARPIICPWTKVPRP